MGIAIRIGGLAVGSSGSSWTTTQFGLPSSGISLIVGTEVTIYGDELVAVPVVNTLSVIYTCDIGSQVGNNFVVNPITANIGSHNLTIKLTNAGKSVTKIITLVVCSKVLEGNINILMIGDSTLLGDIYRIGIALESVLTNNTITYLGTKDTSPRFNEGIAGFTFGRFASGTFAGNPFGIGGVLNVPQYFIDNSIAVPDIVYFRLGLNDTINYSIAGSDMTDANLASIFSGSDALINAFLAYNANLRIIIAIPTTCVNTTDRWDADYGGTGQIQDKFIDIIHRFQVALVARYNNYDPRVSMSYEAINLDRDAGYVSGIHLTNGGGTQLGLGFAVYLNNFIKGYISRVYVPNTLATTVVSDTRIDLSCVAGSAHETGFSWERSLNGTTNWVVLGITGAGVVTYSDTTCVASTRYYYRVRAYWGDLYSDYSNIANTWTAMLLSMVKRGTGATVSTIKLQTTADVAMTIDGSGNFYDDAGGTTGANTSRTITANAERTFYLKVATGTSKVLIFHKNDLVYWTNWSPVDANAPYVTFSLIGLARSLTWVQTAGSSTVSGALADLPPNLTKLYLPGIVSGSLSDLPVTITYASLNAATNTISGYVSGHTWNANMNYFIVNSSAGNGLDSTEVDNLIHDLSLVAWAGASRTLTIAGNNAARTHASDADKATLVGKTVTCTFNEPA